MPAQSLEVRATRPPHGDVGVEPGTQNAGKERHVPAIAVARVSPADVRIGRIVERRTVDEAGGTRNGCV